MSDPVGEKKEHGFETPILDEIQVFYEDKDERRMGDRKALPSKPETYDRLSPKELKEYLHTREEEIRATRTETGVRVDRLMEQSRIDELTGLENRRSFDEGMLSAVNRAYRAGSKIFLVMIDVDFFKKVNDTYGHSAGDYVLKEFGKILKTDNLLRKSEKPFRYGGEEFAILVDGDPNDSKAHEKVVKLCERIRGEVERHKFVFDGKKIPVTISLGVAGFDQVKVSDERIEEIRKTDRTELAALDGKGRKELIELADSALYAAKGKNGNGGRNRTVFADEEKDPVYKQFLIDQAVARG